MKAEYDSFENEWKRERERIKGLSRPEYMRHWRRERLKDPHIASKIQAREREREKQRRLRKYGLTEDDYFLLQIEQYGRCAICFVVLERGRGRNSENIDHCHETGQVRGLLCRACNVALGCANDDPDLLEAMANYLREHDADG